MQKRRFDYYCIKGVFFNIFTCQAIFTYLCILVDNEFVSEIEAVRRERLTIRELFPISSHVISTVTLRIFKQVHPVLRTPRMPRYKKYQIRHIESWKVAKCGDVISESGSEKVAKGRLR